MSDDFASLYELLGLTPRATVDQIDKAFRFFDSMYDEGALATYSLLASEEARAARSRLREAYGLLKDPVKRHEYDVAHGFARADEPLLPLAAGDGNGAVPALPAEPTVLPDPVDGASLRRLREDRGVSLQQIASVSKVGVRILQCIEQDRHDALPAPVYLRGFLREYARAVGLHPQRTADAYMKRL